MDGHLTAFDSNRRKEGGRLSVTPLHQIIHCCLRTVWHPCIKNMLHGYVNQLKPPPPPQIYNLNFCCFCFSNFQLPIRPKTQTSGCSDCLKWVPHTAYIFTSFYTHVYTLCYLQWMYLYSPSNPLTSFPQASFVSPCQPLVTLPLSGRLLGGWAEGEGEEGSQTLTSDCYFGPAFI